VKRKQNASLLLVSPAVVGSNKTNCPDHVLCFGLAYADMVFSHCFTERQTGPSRLGGFSVDAATPNVSIDSH
jgi:hypothetical protein